MKETMTVHKALTELKIQDSRIEKAINECQLVCSNKHSNAKIGGEPISEFVNNAKSQFQSVQTLIARRNAIKRAVTRSNAVTTVSIGGETYTVAEAIDMKQKGVEYLRSLVRLLENQYSSAKYTADRENGERLEARADDYIKSMYGGADLKNMADEIVKMRETFIAAQTIEIVDPIGAQKEITRLQDKIDNFMSDVDSALSVSNALTTVEVECETK